MKPLDFGGSGFEYFKIWIVNILLILITLGVYYPWAKVRNQRYFYANTTLEGRNFEYHATGKQLLMGYIIAMVFLMVVSIVQNVSPIGALGAFLGLSIIIPWVVWRSLAFSMRMSSFSNVRFRFVGDLKGAYINFMLLPGLLLLCIYGGPSLVLLWLITLPTSIGMEEGLLIATFAFVLIVLMVYLFAFLKNKNTHYMVNGYRFGQGQFSTLLETQKFVKILLKTLGLAVLILMSIAILTVFMMVLVGGFPSLLNIFSQDASDILEWLLRHNIEGALGLVYIAFLMATFILVAYFQSQVRQYVFANTVLNGKVNFSSSLTTISLAWLMMSNFLLVLVTLGLGTPWAKVRRAKLILKNTLVDVEHGIDGFITQQQDKQSALGEQIGDAFDVDIGIGV
ncbi:YjgN family protein [Oceanospirillaceae bacterium]|nr:YjgN family protein [Oceanospirillaceae bacterium]MDO7574322.1 YjgN family protein [Oceanospirillaceae bacterium]